LSLFLQTSKLERLRITTFLSLTVAGRRRYIDTNNDFINLQYWSMGFLGKFDHLTTMKKLFAAKKWSSLKMFLLDELQT
jgi:hypothetical protein